MSIRRNIRIMYAIALLQGMVFYAPIATLYRQNVGLGVFEIALIESISLAISIAMELPWGVVADRIGYRRSMVVCCMLWFVSKLVFWWAGGFGMFLLERVLLGVVTAGLSGLDQSILYCSTDEEDAQGVFGVYENLGTVGVLFAAAVYSLFIGDDYRLAALLTAVSYGAAAILSLGLVEVRVAGTDQRSALGDFGSAVRSLLSDRRMLLLVIGCALLMEVRQTVCVFLNQLQYVRCGMSDTAIGVVYIGVTLLALIGGLSARLTRRFGAKRLGTVLFFGCTAACAMLAVTQSAWLSVLCVGMIHGCASLLWPLKSDLVNCRIDSPNRATALSVAQLLEDGVAIGVSLMLGRLSDSHLPSALICGAVLSMAGLILFRKGQKNA